ncbi:MAG: hypothetical protein HY941_09700 [Gammaproteobacteria bacterium]|nr:hypothetical protein [Gammaproteobacteria bacterium]
MTVKPQFSSQPGAHERQLIRCADNPLFPAQRRHVIQIEVTQAQRHDAEEAQAFQTDFRTLLQRAIELDPQADSDVILKLKEDIDHTYERCCGLGGDRQEIKTALRKLLEHVMRAVWHGAANDPAAQANLREEELAREAHFQLLELPFIADLIRPDSPIGPDELIPSLLSESAESVAAALELFDADHLIVLCRDARALLEALPQAPAELATAWARLAQLEARQHAGSRLTPD